MIILPLSLVLFGVLIDRAGFVPAMMVLIFGSATASTEFKFVEVLLFSVFLTALCGGRLHLGPWPALSADRGLPVTTLMDLFHNLIFGFGSRSRCRTCSTA